MCPAAAAKHLSMSADSLRTIMFRQIDERVVSMETILGAGNQRLVTLSMSAAVTVPRTTNPNRAPSSPPWQLALQALLQQS
jgi:hypothetical protein